MSSEYIFTSESVTAGHPDKLCDQISDALVGLYLCQDPAARVVAECAVSTGILFVSLNASARASVDVPNAAREVILAAGYDRGSFDGRSCTVMTSQSSNGFLPAANPDAPLLARENITLFGYACDQTPALLPLPIWLANRLSRRLDDMRHHELSYLAPDAKCQVGVTFRDHQPQRIHSISIVASQHPGGPALSQLRSDLQEQVIAAVFADEAIQPDRDTRIYINPAGPVIEGGPAMHTGLTGRKTSVDTYGGFSRQSSAALSGKDPSRIERSGAYAARHAARSIIAAGLAPRCEVQLSYSIGQAEPVSIRVDTFGSSRLSDEELTRQISRTHDFSVGGIIEHFRLSELAQHCHGRFYQHLAAYGHFGRPELELPWEQ